MLKKLDIYIIKRFLTTYFFSIILIISIAIVFDIQEKIEDFISTDCTVNEIIFDYYLNFVPYFANLFSSLFTFVAVIFFTSKMAFSSEIIAIHASGVSFNRFLRPYMISAGIITILSLFLILYVIPESNKIRLDFDAKYIHTSFSNREENIHRQILPGVFVYMDSYNVKSKVGYKFSMEKFEDGELVSKLVSDYTKWDTTINKWKIYNYYVREYKDGKEIITKGKRLDTTLTISPVDFEKRDNDVERMNIVELNKYIEQEKLHGSDIIIELEVNKYQRYSLPFSTFILTLLGVSIANRKRRGGIGANIGIGLLMSFTYILFMQISTTFAINSNMNPIISVWIPNFLYSLIAIYFYRKAVI